MWRVKALFDAGRVCMSLLGQVLRGLGGSPHQKAWTLILWNQADVPLPDQLKGPDGLHKVYDLLVDKFATSRGYDLHCVKLACGWLGETTRAIKQLAPLMKLGHLEALTVVHRGRERGASTTDRLLRQAAQRFMQLLDKQKGPEHLIVFITSDADICSKIKQLQRQNCKIVVVYFKPNCSTVPDSISDAADEAYWWLSFLRQGLQMPRLRIRHHNQLSSAVARDHTYEQPTSPRPKVVEQSHVLSSDEIDSSNSHESREQSVESEDELGELPMHTEDNTLMSAVASWVKDVKREQQLQPMLEQHPVSVLSSSAQPVPVISEARQYTKNPQNMGKYGFDHKENKPHFGQNCYQGAPRQQTHGRSQQAAIKHLLGSITLDHEGWTKLEELLQNILHVGFRHRQDVINLAAQVCNAAMPDAEKHAIFADVCYHLETRLPDFESGAQEGANHFSTFRKGLFQKCKKELGKGRAAQQAMYDLGQSERQAVLQNSAMAPMKTLNGISFMVNLYDRKLITDTLMHQCIWYLLDPVSLDLRHIYCLSKLMKAVGQQLDSHPGARKSMTSYFDHMSHLVATADLPIHARCLLQGMCKLRSASWIPYRAVPPHTKPAANVARVLFQ